MRATWRGAVVAAAIGLAGGILLTARAEGPSGPGPLLLHARSRVPSATAPGGYEAVERAVAWEPKKTALIICDMWDRHWCKGATGRCAELAPAMDRAVSAARARGVLIIHAPSSCMAPYKDHPARKRAQAAPKAANLPKEIDAWCYKIPSEEKGVYPVDQADGGCDDGPACPQGSPWKSQIAAIGIRDEDAISDSGTEIWNLMEDRGIENVMILGVHTNMCVLGRPFGLRQMARNGKNVVLVRDLTDTMYNSRSWPYISHHEGTARIVEHVEKFVCPTITSTDLTGQPAFAFKPDDRPRAVFLIGDDEYKTEETLPAFAKSELEPRGIRCTFAVAGPKSPHDFKAAEALADADLLVVSVRRRAPTADQMKAIRRYVDSGRPVIGIRTASHAFDARGKAPAGHAEWKGFDGEVLGGHYTGHHANEVKPKVAVAGGAESHPVLAGVAAPFEGQGSLYKTSPLAASARPLLVGTIDGRPAEPVAWVNLVGTRRVFYTSLGHPGDFAGPSFRRLLRNAFDWALGRPATSSAAATPPAPRGGEKGPLGPEEAVAALRVPDDLRADLVLAEPVVRQPVHLSFDERGRLWVVQYLQYPFPAGLKMLSRDGVWRAVYDKVPLAPPHHVRGRDKVTIHEDTDGDGRFDRHKTFVDGLNIATSVARGRGGVWILNPPYLLFYPDRDGDDVPDGDPEVHLRGFGLEDTHAVVNSLRWGPDGWLYATQGSTVSGHVARPGLDDGKEPAHSMGQLVWRYHPETRRYEVFAEGGGNAFGVELDRRGRIFSGHNGGDTRGFHYVQGAYLQKGFAKHGELSNPYAFGYFPAMKHNRVPRFTHTFTIYEAETLPARYRGRLFGVAPLLNHVVMSEVLPDGSSVQTRDVGHAVTTDDPWFRPVDITLGPDGCLYVADWYDRQVNHFRNHEGQIDPGSGRIYRLGPKGAQPGAGIPRPADLSRRTTPELVEALRDPNRWTRQTALRLIADRKDASVAPDLRRRLGSSTGQEALEALWALNLVGGLDEATALRSLGHPNRDVRIWTVRLLGDEKKASPAVAAGLAALAEGEKDVEVRSQLACTAKRLPAAEALPIVARLLARDEDAGDVHLPLLLWWAVESKVGTDPDAVLALFEDRTLWTRPIVAGTVSERLMRRLAAAGGRKDLERCARLLALAPGPEATRALLTGFEAAFAGRSLAALPPALAEALAKYAGRSVALGLRRGDPEAVREVLRVLADERGDRSRQLQYVQLLGEVRVDGASGPLLRIACQSPDNALRSAALAALSNYDDPVIADEVLKTFGGLSDDLLSAALGTLASRRPWALRLLEAIDAREVDPRTVPREVVDRLALIADPRVRALVARHFGDVRPATPAALQAEIVRLASAVRSGPGVPKPGRQLFVDRCAKCHALFGKGGKVGPDLTTYRRDDLENMLLNVVNPNAEIREGFAPSVVATADGRTLSGVVVEQDPNVVVLRDADGRDLALPRSGIEEMRPSKVSIMPEGLLKGLTDQQVRDLFAYLRSSQPLID